MCKMSQPPKKQKFQKGVGSTVSKSTYYRHVKDDVEKLLQEAESEVTASTSILQSNEPEPISFQHNAQDEDIDYYSPDEGSDDDEQFQQQGYDNESNDEEETFSPENEAGKKDKSALLEWFIKKITREAANDLLHNILPTLNPSTLLKLPKDVRTLMPKSEKLKVFEKCGGQYTYFGIANALRGQSRTFIDINMSKIELSVNIDGLPLYKSSGSEFWPILGSISNNEVFIIALLFCKKKPADFNEFLSDFVEEANNLVINGITIKDKHYEFSIKNLIT